MISGHLDKLHLGDLLQWLQMGGLSGRLTLLDRGWERRIDLSQGKVVYVSSQVPGERLASWLARTNAIELASLQKLLGLSLIKRRQFTELLLARRVIGKKQLREELTRLAAAIVQKILAAPCLEFKLDTGFKVANPEGVLLSVEPQQLLLEAARLSDEGEALQSTTAQYGLPFSDDAVEQLFWRVVKEGVTGQDPLEGEQLVAAHNLIREILGTIAQWLSSSTGLVPLPTTAVQDVAEQLHYNARVSIAGRPHVVWNHLVLSCAMRRAGAPEPASLPLVEEAANRADLWTEVIASECWHRPGTQRLDELTGRVVSMWSRAAAAAAEHLDIDPDRAALAAHLLVVPTDLVLWVLATMPVAHHGLRQALLHRLPRRIGHGLATIADFSSSLAELMVPARVTPLGVCLHLSRAVVPSAPIWPETVPNGECSLTEVASPEQIARAAAAAHESVEQASTEG